MKNNYIYYLLVFFVLIAVGCTNAITEKDEGRQDVPILLTSTGNVTAEGSTRAVSDFPNNGSIGLVAATTYDPANPMNNWNDYADINNAEATATSEYGGVFNFTWKQQKYWPFDGSDLYFMAYSPVVTDQINYIISDNRAALTMSLDPNLPDVMYATGNITPQPYNKTSGVVNLGEFKHMLSKLTVQVTADASMSPNIMITNLTVSTPMRTASFFLFGGDEGLAVDTAEISYVATLASGNIQFKTQPLVKTMFLFPGTEDTVEVVITLVDTSNSQSFTGEYMMSFFIDNSGAPAILERAKNTVLTIKVLNVGVNDPNRNIQLEGTLKDWDYHGNFGVAIE